MNRFVFPQFTSVAVLAAGLIVAAHAQPSRGDSEYLFVTSTNPGINDAIKRYDAFTGAFVDTFVPHLSGGLHFPWACIFSPHDGSLLVSSGHFGGPPGVKAVLRYDATSGAFLDQFVPPGHLSIPAAVTFGPDGNLYVGDRVENFQPGKIARFDGVSGAYIDDFVVPGSGGLENPLAHVFGPSGISGKLDLYVSDSFSVLRYDGTTGAFLGTYVPPGSGTLDRPYGLTFGPDGNLYVASTGLLGGTSAVLRYQGPSGPEPGAFIDAFVPQGSGGLLQPLGILFGPDANGDAYPELYVNSQEVNLTNFNTKPNTSSVKRYDGVSGAFIDTFIPVSSGGLQGPSLMSFTDSDPVTLAYLGVSETYAATRVVPEPTTGSLLILSILTILSRRAVRRGRFIASEMIA